MTTIYTNAKTAFFIMYPNFNCRRFTVPEVSDDGWESELNPESEIVKARALVDPSILRLSPIPEMHFQFERIGFFVVDKDSTVMT